MAWFDTYCPECGYIIEYGLKGNDEEPPLCPKCEENGKEVKTKKVVGSTSFKLIYDNRKDMCDWDGNTSQYWNEIKRTGGEEPENDRQPKTHTGFGSAK